MTLERPPLEDALGIPGARAVTLLDPDGPTVLWWAGAGPPDERVATAVVTLATAATGLVTVSEPGDELGDVLLTSADAFHVVRVVADGSARVAHLSLRRACANLAMARHEFKALIERFRPTLQHTAPAEPALPSESAGPESTGPDSASPESASPESASPESASPESAAPSESESASEPESASEEGDPGAPLPRRRRSEPPPAVANGSEAPPDWFSMLGQLYRTDDGVLDRILVTLRHL